MNFYVEQIIWYIFLDHSDSPISVLDHLHFGVYGKHFLQQLHRRTFVERYSLKLGKIRIGLFEIADPPILEGPRHIRFAEEAPYQHAPSPTAVPPLSWASKTANQNEHACNCESGGGKQNSRLHDYAPTKSRSIHPKNHKAGLVGPAFFSWNWSVQSCFDHRPRMSKSQSQFALRVTVRVATYITIARFSSSYCNTGMAHPAISTRPAASNAALGETP